MRVAGNRIDDIPQYKDRSSKSPEAVAVVVQFGLCLPSRTISDVDGIDPLFKEALRALSALGLLWAGMQC